MFFYHFMTFLLSMLATPIIWCFRRGRVRAMERFGSWRLEDRVLWFHGASLGEIQGLLPIIRGVRAARPGLGILVTATSPTGLSAVEEIADYAKLLPYDSSFFIRRALRGVEVVALVSSETEVWPGLFHCLSQRSVPIVMVNAKIMERTVRRLKLLGGLARSTLRRVQLILAQSEADAERFTSLGAYPEVVRVVGNSKYERDPTIQSDVEASSLRRKVFQNDAPVLALGSLRPKEESIWYPAISSALSEGHVVNIVVAPRHREQFDFFFQELERSGIQAERWSEIARRGSASNCPVVVLDAFGVLEQWYSFCFAAHVGGTLSGHGGHNPLEAAQYGAALAIGRDVENISDIVAELESRNAVTRIASVDDAIEFIRRVAGRDHELASRGVRAKEFVRSMKGATEQCVQAILRI